VHVLAGRFAFAGVPVSWSQHDPGSVAGGRTGAVIWVTEPVTEPFPEPPGEAWIYRWPAVPAVPTLAIARAAGGYLVRFPGVAELHISPDGGQVRPWLAPGTSLDTLQHLLLDQTLPRVLAHRGHTVLHAGGVAIDDRAVAFVGPTGRGKSTLTASFDLAGHPALSDDGLVLSLVGDEVLAIPTYPSLRLWPDAIASLFDQPPAVAVMADYSAKQRLTSHAAAIVPEPSRLACLYVLGDHHDRPWIDPLSPRDTAMAIIANTFQLDVSDKHRAAGLLEAATGLAERLPTFALHYPRDFSRLAAVRDAIVNHMRSLA
jgi:hypothetical protein